MDDKTKSAEFIQKEIQAIIDRFGFQRVDTKGTQTIMGFVQTRDRKFNIEISFPINYPEESIILSLPKTLEKHSMFHELPEIVKETASPHFSALQVLELIELKISSIPARDLEELFIAECAEIIQKEMQAIIDRFGFSRVDTEGTQTIMGFLQTRDRKFNIEISFPINYPEECITLSLPKTLEKHSMFHELPEIVEETASPHFSALQVLELIEAKISSIPTKDLEERFIDELEGELNIITTKYNVKSIEGKKYHIRIFYQVENWVNFDLEIDFRDYPQKPKIMIPAGLINVVGLPETLGTIQSWDVDNPNHIIEIVKEIEQRFSKIYRVDDTIRRVAVSNLTLATPKNRILTQRISFSAIRGGIIGIYCLKPEAPRAIFNAFSGIGNRIEGNISIFGKPPSMGLGIEQVTFILPPQEAELLEKLSIEEVLNKNAPKGKLKRDIKTLLNDFLTIIGLSNRRKLKLKDLAEGEKRRVMIAYSAIKLPEIIFLVEPAKYLNATEKKRIWDSIIGINEKFSITFFIYSTSEEIKRCHNILVLSDEGKQLGFGTLRQLIKELPLDKEVLVVQFNSPNPKDVKALEGITNLTFLIEEVPGERFRLFTKVDPNIIISQIFRKIGSNIHNLSREQPSLSDYVPYKTSQEK